MEDNVRMDLIKMRRVDSVQGIDYSRVFFNEALNLRFSKAMKLVNFPRQNYLTHGVAY